MKVKVEIKSIPLYGLFICDKHVWRSLGNIRKESFVISAQKVYMNEYDTEVYTDNGDFIEDFKVIPYYGELPKIPKNTFCSPSYYHCLTQNFFSYETNTFIR